MYLFAEQVFRSTYYCCWKHIALDSEFFVLLTLEKYHQISLSCPWSTTYNLGWIKLRKIKSVKIMFSCENYNIFTFFLCCLPETWTKDHIHGPRTIENSHFFFPTPNKIFMPGTWNFRIIEKKIKAIFKEYFSSLHFDSGKIFKLMTFRRGPRTTYCTIFDTFLLWEFNWYNLWIGDFL